MMRHINFGLTLLAVILLTSCIGSSVYEKKLSPGYELSANDDLSGMTIYVNEGQYQVGVLPATVFSVGFDQEFIIAKQHPLINNTINKSVTNYYVIPIKDKVSTWPDLNRIGPLTQKEFLLQRKTLNISDKLEFTITIEDLE